MKKFAVLGAVLAALVVAAPAQAADVPIRGPIYKAAPAPVYNWTGFYVGAHVGYGWASSGLGDLDGFLGGVQAGYNWQFSRNWVFGIEGDISATDMNDLRVGHRRRCRLPRLDPRASRLHGGITCCSTVPAGAAFTRVSALGASTVGKRLRAAAPVSSGRSRTAGPRRSNISFYDIDAFETSALKFGVNYRF